MTVRAPKQVRISQTIINCSISAINAIRANIMKDAISAIIEIFRKIRYQHIEIPEQQHFHIMN